MRFVGVGVGWLVVWVVWLGWRKRGWECGGRCEGFICWVNAKQCVVEVKEAEVKVRVCV